MKNQTVVVLGASPKRSRYSNRAVRMLKEHGYRVLPVHPAVDTIEDLPVIPRLGEIDEDVHTLTLYLGPRNSLPISAEIVKLSPGRVIMNPGTESRELYERLTEAGIEVVQACTLVLLTTGQF